MDEKITDEKQNIEAIYQQRLKENTEQVINCKIKPQQKKTNENFSSILEKTTRRKMYTI